MTILYIFISIVTELYKGEQQLLSPSHGVRTANTLAFIAENPSSPFSALGRLISQVGLADRMRGFQLRLNVAFRVAISNAIKQ